MNLLGVTVLAWLLVRAAGILLWWAVLAVWLLLRGMWFLTVTVPRRAWRRHRATVEYNDLIEHLGANPAAPGRLIDQLP